MKFAIYSQATGQILRTFTGPSSDAALQLQGGDAVLLMQTGDDSTHYVANGAFVAIPSSPSTNHAFDWSAKAWIDPRTLQDMRDARWAVIKQARENKISSNLVTPYGVFDADTQARSNITDSIMLLQTLEGLGTPTTIDFTLADNSTVTLTTAAMVTVGLLLGQKVQTSYSIARGLRAQIEAATTTAALEAITWPAT